MAQPFSVPQTYRYLAERSGSSHRELYVCGTSLRAQSLVSDLENEGVSSEQISEAYHIPPGAVQEAIEYVHKNEAYLAGERCRSREQAIAKGYLRPSQ